MNKIFSDIAWQHYLSWWKEDKSVVIRINELINSIENDHSNGIGKPEPLFCELSGYWSRRITNVHRLIYSIQGDSIYIASCKDI